MKTIKLYNEIKAELLNVIDAENAAAAWKQEARNRMKDVSALIVAAKKVNKETEIDAKTLIDFIREEIAAENEEEPAEPTDPDAYMDRETATAE